MDAYSQQIIVSVIKAYPSYNVIEMQMTEMQMTQDHATGPSHKLAGVAAIGECYTGGKHDSNDTRDFQRRYGAGDIPSDDHPKADLREYIQEVYDQGTLECCTPTALCSAFRLILQKQAEALNLTHYHFEPSRLFVYYNARGYIDKTAENVGVSIRDTFRAMNKKGVCLESFWPYDVKKFAEKPPDACYKAAEDNVICEYARVGQEIDQFRACLNAGFPFVFLMELYDSFKGIGSDGMMPMPSKMEILLKKNFLHAVLAVGYDDDQKCIMVLNSWGSSFGDKGYIYMPYDYIIDTKRTFSHWKIEKIEEKGIDSISQNP